MLRPWEDVTLMRDPEDELMHRGSAAAHSPPAGTSTRVRLEHARTHARRGEPEHARSPPPYSRGGSVGALPPAAAARWTRARRFSRYRGLRPPPPPDDEL